jgi:hypothetical protein
VDHFCLPRSASNPDENTVKLYKTGLDGSLYLGSRLVHKVINLRLVLQENRPNRPAKEKKKLSLNLANDELETNTC